jgi:pimeloyl-ACP methyl ester carboxylesterase
MHGYSGDRTAVALDLTELAPKGVFAIAPDMRGRGGSAGRWDSGGLDVHDIADAVLEAVRRWPREIDASSLHVMGYSGGGGNAIACMVRLPDLFRTYTSFFGISDYGGWHRSRGRPDCNVRMEEALGGGPDALPDVYLARNAIPAAANARCGKLHFFWDVQEAGCPPDMVQAFVDAHRSAGLRGARVHVSRPGDRVRWIHGYRRDSPGLRSADAVVLRDVLRARGRSSRLPKRGRLVVPGYVVTRWFQVWVEDGQRGQVTVEYDCRTAIPVVRVVDNPGGYTVRIVPTSPFAALP